MEYAPTVLWCIGIIAALTAASVVVRHSRADVADVAGWHNRIWIVVLALIAAELITYEPASTAAWLTLLAGLMAFNLGVLLAPSRRMAEDYETKVPPPLLTPTQMAVLTLVYLVGFTVYLSVIHDLFGLSVLIESPETIRSAKGESYLAQVPIWARLAIFLGPILLVAYGWRPALTKPINPVARWVGFAVLVATQLALLQRTNLFMGILWLVAMVLSLPRSRRVGKSQVKRVAALIVAAVALFVAFQGLAGALGKTAESAATSGTVSPVLQQTGTTSPYIYATGGTMAFLHLSDSQNDSPVPPNDRSTIVVGDYNPQTWGRATGYLALKVVPIAEPHEPIAPFVDIGILTNVYTWFEPFYRDFRALGVALGSLFLGALVASLYGRRMLNARTYWLSAALLSCMFLAPFVAKFHSTIFIVGVLAVLWLSRTNAKAGRPAELSVR